MIEHLALILIGGPIAIGAPAGVAVYLCERHANQTAAAIRQHHAQPVQAPPQIRTVRRSVAALPQKQEAAAR